MGCLFGEPGHRAAGALFSGKEGKRQWHVESATWIKEASAKPILCILPAKDATLGTSTTSITHVAHNESHAVTQTETVLELKENGLR